MNQNKKNMIPLQGKRAVLYRRVSTTDQKLYGNSLNAQQSSLKDFCHKNSLTIIEEFQEDYSAKNFNRPEWKKLNKFAQKNKAKIDYLLVFDWDRFSRNTYEALGVINDFEKLGIEVNCIEKWIDYSDPTQIMMQLMYLGMPEVDNKVRSQKVRIGMRQGLKEGRWNVKQPVGFIPGKDELGKPLMQQDCIKAPLIKELFELFATGVYSQNELRTMSKFKSLNLSKSNLSRILKNPLYAGKIKVPAYNEELEEIIEGLHKAIIDSETFTKVQYQLGVKSRYKQKTNTTNDSFPLRGHLKCTKCGGNLTGSASKSKTGKKHYYYHCNPRIGCNERFKVALAHNSIQDEFNSLKPNEEVLNLFELILKDQFENSETSNKSIIKSINDKIKKLEKRKSSLLDKLLDELITDELFNSKDKELKSEIDKLKMERGQLNDYEKDAMEFTKFGIHMIKNLGSFFEKATVNTKQKLLSSIFKEKLVFDGGKYRTPILNKGIELISKSIKILECLKNKNGRLSFDNLPLCTRGGT